MGAGLLRALLVTGAVSCVGVDPGNEASSGMAVDGDRIQAIVDARGALAPETDVAVDLAEDRYAGLTFSAHEGDLVRVVAKDPGGLADPVVLVYGPREDGGGWTARLAKQDRESGASEESGAIAIAATGTYLAVVGDFERRAASLVVRLEPAPPPTVPVPVITTGWIFGTDTGSHDQAVSSWQAACDRWVEETAALLEGTARGPFTCGTTQDLDTSPWELLASRPTLKVTAQLPEGALPFASTPRRVTGPSKARQDEALQGWQTECSALLAASAETYGDRLLGAACEPPTDVDSSGWYRYASPATLTLAPVAGGATEVTGYVFGTDVASDDDADAAGLAACDAWVADAVRRFGADRLVSYDCGATTDIDSSPWAMYAGHPVARFALPPNAGTLEVTTQTATGGSKANQRDALVEWRAACATALDHFAQLYGARLAGAGCAEPRDVDTSPWYQMGSEATASILP